MRLHRLEVTAFGPYVGHQVVDFDELGTDGLFLLHGDTGAGKTTLLDAIAYALFGTVPGARGEVRRLRSDLAAPDVVTSVELELTVQGHRFVVSRSPEYFRPKKRGEGFTKQNAKGSLVWLDTPGPSGDGLTRLDEISRTVQGLVGMSAEQFFQVVLLPQGEFARFLRADTAEREQLLEKLFGTHRFADVEKWFYEQRSGKRAELAAEEEREKLLVARIAQVTGSEPPEHEVEESWLGELLDERTTALAKAEEQERAARFATTEAGRAAQTARERVQRVLRVREATADLAALDERKPERTAMAQALVAARRAVPVVAANRVLAEVSARVRIAERAVGNALTGLADSAELAEEPGAALRAKAAEYRQRGGELSALVEQAQQQREDVRRVAELTDRGKELGETVGKLDGELTALPAAIADARARLDKANRSAAVVDSVAARKETVAEQLALARRIPRLRADLDKAESAHRGMVDVHQRARERMLDLRASRLHSMAAELAGELKSGKPCAVCGSRAHPAPAPLTLDVVGEEAEAAASTAEQEASANRDTAAKAVHAQQVTLGAATERLAGADEQSLVESLAAAEKEHGALAAEAAELAALAEKLRIEETAQGELRDQLANARTERAAAEAELATVLTRVRGRAERLEAARGAFSGVEEHRDHLLGQAKAIDLLADARAELDLRRGAEAEQRAACDEAVSSAGFADIAAALAAARDEAQFAELERALEDSARVEMRARSVLDDPNLAGVDPAENVDASAAEERLNAATAALEQAVGILRGKRREREEASDLAGRLRQHWRRNTPLRERFAELNALTDVVNGRGQNAKRMSLRTFVLAARLEEVAIAATSRLRTMSQGRYAFVHSIAAGAHGTRGGLGIDVRDDYSGQIRPAKTLSGGESFLASLALALGLADVVAAQTGGAQLDTLFVDEGFGTLDADTLEDVMGILDELRAGGRTIGLVSHVDELRQRVPTQLRVRKSRSGSTVEVIS